MWKPVWQPVEGIPILADGLSAAKGNVAFGFSPVKSAYGVKIELGIALQKNTTHEPLARCMMRPLSPDEVS